MADDVDSAIRFEALADEIARLKERLPDKPAVVARDQIEDEQVVISSDRAGLAWSFLDAAEKACRTDEADEDRLIEWAIHNQTNLDLYVHVLPDGEQPPLPVVSETLWTKIWMTAMSIGCLSLVALFFIGVVKGCEEVLGK